MAENDRNQTDGSFKATDNKGFVHTVYIKIGDAQNFITANGNVVRRIKKGEYRIIQSGRVLRSEDPAAP